MHLPLGTVAVVGGGINGLCIAWELARLGWQVELYERDHCLAQTSSTSTKLLHGGLRYLEQGHLALVAESLRHRGRWLRDVPQHCHWLQLLLPIYANQRRPAWQWQLGLGFYDGLALGQLPRFARWLNPEAVQALQPDLVRDGLQGAWQFWDGQMDKQELGQWVLAQAKVCGVQINEYEPVENLSSNGWLTTSIGSFRFDWVVNAAGPWAVELLQQSGISTNVKLVLVRGSHMLLPSPNGRSLPSTGLFVEVPGSARIAFLLPYQGELLVGTTEEVQSLGEPIAASNNEQQLLRELVARYLPAWADTVFQQERFFLACARSFIAPMAKPVMCREQAEMLYLGAIAN